MKCLLCGVDEKEVFNKTESFGFQVVYYQCQNCGLIFQSPGESQAADPAFYEETYRNIYQSSVEPTKKDLWVQEHRAEHLVRLLKAHRPNFIPQRILDIGASTGVLLRKSQEFFGSEVIGVEPGEAYRAFAEGEGLEMYPSLDALLEKNPKRFDLVTLSHVLEHLPDPIGTLQLIRQSLLLENGVLLLEVPNFYAHDSFELAHLVCYTPHSLREVLRQAGFKVTFLQTHGIPRSILLNLYITVLASPRTDEVRGHAIKPDRFVRMKRRMGFVYRRFIQKLFPNKAWLPLPKQKVS